LVIVAVFGAGVTLVQQHPGGAGKFHDESGGSAHKKLETTALIEPWPSTVDVSSGHTQPTGPASPLDHSRSDPKATVLQVGELEADLREAPNRAATAAQKQVDGPSQPGHQAVEESRAFQVRISALEAELRKR